ncbi:hypothetical protein ACWCPS_38930 [Streptomyces mauvecolor]
MTATAAYLAVDHPHFFPQSIALDVATTAALSASNRAALRLPGPWAMVLHEPVPLAAVEADDEELETLLDGEQVPGAGHAVLGGVLAAHPDHTLDTTLGLILVTSVHARRGRQWYLQPSAYGDHGAGRLMCSYAAQLAFAKWRKSPAPPAQERGKPGSAKALERLTKHPDARAGALFLTANGAGCVLFTAGCFAASAAQQQGDRMSPEALVGSLVGGLLAIWAGTVVLRATRPRAARGAAQELLADGRRPVLFLRSFDDDRTAAQVEDAADLHIHSREEQLAAALKAVGPVIAVSPPVQDGERLPLPQLGAARFHLPREPRDGWQQPVLDLMELSQLIVLRLGLGEGLWWEYDQARTGHPTRKLVVLVPGGLPGLDQQMAGHQLPPVRPVEAGDGDPWISAIITFDPDETPRVHPVAQRPGGKSWLVRAWAVLSLRAGVLDRASSTAHIAVTLQSALRSVGIRRRGLAVRASAAQQKALGEGVRLVTVLLLLLWLGVRTLQLLGLRIVL